MRDQLRRLVRSVILEGGLKLSPEKRVELTSELVKRACSAYVDFLDGWNRWLVERGRSPVEPIGPSGSSAHAAADAAERRAAIYGDVDYLVSVPLAAAPSDFGERRKAQAAVEREYVSLMADYLRLARPEGVDVEATLKPGGMPS